MCSGRLLIGANVDRDVKKSRPDKVAKQQCKLPRRDELPVETTFLLRALVISGVDLPSDEKNLFVCVSIGNTCVATKKVRVTAHVSLLSLRGFWGVCGVVLCGFLLLLFVGATRDCVGHLSVSSQRLLVGCAGVSHQGHRPVAGADFRGGEAARGCPTNARHVHLPLQGPGIEGPVT